MIIGFKRRFDETVRLFKNSKVTMRLPYVPHEIARRVAWPMSVEPFFPLALRCVAREESFGYVLVAGDILFAVDRLTIMILGMCDGFNTSREIKQRAQEELWLPKEAQESIDLATSIEHTLANLGRYGIVVWMPQSQAHLDRRKGEQSVG
jgi:hypothetical protein